LSIRFGQDFEVKLQARFAAGVWSVFVLLMFCRGYVESNLNLGRDSEARFGHIPDICHFFTRAKFLENKIYTEKRQFFALNL